MGPRTRPADKEKLVQMDLLFREIQSIYDAGTPIFTKDNIRQVGKELHRFQNGDRNNGGNITMRGVNGVDYEVFVPPPIRRPPRENEICSDPAWVIHYCAIEYLTSFKYPDVAIFDLQSAYLPMRIGSIVRIQKKNLKSCSLELQRPAAPEEDLNTYRAIERHWKTTEHYAQLQEVLSNIEIPFPLTKVIAVASGKLVFQSQVSKRRVLHHSLVSDLRLTLVRRGFLLDAASPTQPYVQDPAYTQRDTDILRSAGFTVLNDPQAWLELDESSVLVCINTDLPVADIVADICRPALIIWDKKRGPHPYCAVTPRVKAMIENEYVETKFPDHECFGDLVMLIRKAT
ncbi:uncharacterized protein GGS22DRAFT_166374 [Annulohypoxylon maeteangense]|uniref:uncharacterized protein n=1 Tax=Annulohypoxylon maeteangense TaxID=1927788 RepID=UPI002007F172|nr:uncharacterized protein GGS22DRAFT_166374 [Annulohypoxylon maeteangense]KAI0883909.1 hypothetical protein GGS22DRAFT_166374 [Annulohypoxylon maeteangense]